jgi:hypothetical protein
MNDLHEQLRQLQKEAHACAVAKGFWEGGPAAEFMRETKLALIHSELSEALDCIARRQLEACADAGGKPVGLPTELADVVLRCLGFGEAYGLDVIPRPIKYDPEAVYDLSPRFGAVHINGSHQYVALENLRTVVERCFDMANAYKIDLLAACKQKHAYNLTRELMHGGKAF